MYNIFAEFRGPLIRTMYFHLTKYKMNINQDIVPTTLEEAVNILKNGLSDDDIYEIRNPNFGSNRLHFTMGILIRNEWSLWNKDTILVKWFESIYKLTHADDISKIILECLCNDVRNEPRKDKSMSIGIIDNGYPENKN